MTSRPILFSGPMVRAILDGRKTVTRRVVKVLPHAAPREPLSLGHTCLDTGVGLEMDRRRCQYESAAPSTGHAGLDALKPMRRGDRLIDRAAKMTDSGRRFVVRARAFTMTNRDLGARITMLFGTYPRNRVAGEHAIRMAAAQVRRLRDERLRLNAELRRCRCVLGRLPHEGRCDCCGGAT